MFGCVKQLYMLASCLTCLFKGAVHLMRSERQKVVKGFFLLLQKCALFLPFFSKMRFVSLLLSIRTLSTTLCCNAIASSISPAREWTHAMSTHRSSVCSDSMPRQYLQFCLLLHM